MDLLKKIPKGPQARKIFRINRKKKAKRLKEDVLHPFSGIYGVFQAFTALLKTSINSSH
jgi:hypothetical protein